MAEENAQKIIGDIEEQKDADKIIDNIEEEKVTRPEYLDESLVNVRVCCPSLMFKLCPCFMFSCFSVIIACIISCIRAVCKVFYNCGAGCCRCVKNCFVSCFNCGKACLRCPINCCLKTCSPCIKCFGCIYKCFLSCLMKLNCCNIACGLPCRSPPGCVCIFPCKLCGFGLTCPYFCFSCGCKHCIKMPKDEQNYWRSQKGSAQEANRLAKEGGEPKMNEEAIGEDANELRKEAENLRKQIKELQQAPVQEEVKC